MPIIAKARRLRPSRKIAFRATLLAAMKVVWIDRKTPTKVVRVAIFRLSRSSSICRPLRAKFGGRAPPKMCAALARP